MIDLTLNLAESDLMGRIDRMWAVSAAKIDGLEMACPPGSASPVFTVEGKYTAKGWTEWTQGFQYGSALLQFDATGDEAFLEMGRERTRDVMAPHVTHFGVHDHGFNNVSTYGNLWRLATEGRIDTNPWERSFYELALKCSGAVQGRRWSDLGEGRGYIHSFNGPHSLFADTIRSLRALAMSHQFGHVLMGEQDAAISLLGRLIQHARTTAEYIVFYGDGRDAYDISGRVVHEYVFNMASGSPRCPNSQQGYSPFTTWTRGLAWVMLGYAEQLEYLATRTDEELAPSGGRREIEAMMLRAATATCDFYIANTPTDGVCYWDTGAPGLTRLGDYLDRPADPFNDYEPVDSSAATIGCQGLLRLGHYLRGRDDKAAERYRQAGLITLNTLLGEPYLSADADHQGLILHSIYHRPNGWDHVPAGATIPRGESSMWGDYHAREAAVYVQRIVREEPYYAFYGESVDD